VIDLFEGCLAATTFNLIPLAPGDIRNEMPQGNYFIQGGVNTLLDILQKRKIENIFPTAPLHVAAALVQERFGYVTWIEGIEEILPCIPDTLILGVGNGLLTVSYNRDDTCIPYCSSPEICPVTGDRHSQPLYDLLAHAIPEGYVLISHQLNPGIGAIRGEELQKIFQTIQHRSRLIIGTACKCHGIITALKKP
jgi:hypothetical protein